MKLRNTKTAWFVHLGAQMESNTVNQESQRTDTSFELQAALGKLGIAS